MTKLKPCTMRALGARRERDEGEHAHHLPLLIHRRAAGIAEGSGGVRLDHRLIGHVLLEAGHRAVGDGGVQARRTC